MVLRQEMSVTRDMFLRTAISRKKLRISRKTSKPYFESRVYAFTIKIL